MDELYTRFAKLPPAAQQAITSPEALDAIELLEERYSLPLAETLVRVLIGDIAQRDLPKMFVQTFNLSPASADELAVVLQDTLLQTSVPAPQTSDAVPMPPSSQPAPPRIVGARMQPPPFTKPSPQRVSPNAVAETSAPSHHLPVAEAKVQRPTANDQLPTTSDQLSTAVRQPAPSVVAAKAVPPNRPARIPVPAVPRPLPSSPPPLQPARTMPATPAPAAPSAPSTAAPHSAARPTARFYLHPDDEADIRQHQTLLAHTHADAVPPADGDEAFVRALITQHQLHLADAQLAQRFRMAVLSRLRGIRDSAAFQALVQRPVEAGGLGLAAAAAAQLTGQIAAAAAARQEGKLSAATPARGAVAARASSSAPPVVPAAVRAAARGMRLEPPVPPRPTVVPPRAPIAPPPPAPRSRLRRDVQDDGSGRPVIQDIRRPAQPTGPVEELSAFVPDDLRVPGRDPTHVIGQILEKIRLLTEESYELRAQGIAAWRRSPLFQLYMDIGRESMTTGSSVEDVFQAYTRAGKPALTAQEFLSVADLNRQLTV